MSVLLTVVRMSDVEKIPLSPQFSVKIQRIKNTKNYQEIFESCKEQSPSIHGCTLHLCGDCSIHIY